MKVSNLPTLFPPLETQDDGASGKSALPAEVRANFEAIHAIARDQRRLEQQERILQSGETSGGGAAAGVKRKKIEEEEESDEVTSSVNRSEALEVRKVRLAEATAVAVESEISRLTNGIAELEELLARQQGDQNDPVEITFPSLPSVVPDDSDEEVKERKFE